MVVERRENVGGQGAAEFIEVSGYDPWACLVVNAGKPSGIDAVTVTFNKEDDYLRIDAQDSDTTQIALVMINKAFADKYLADAQGNVEVKKSDAVNYEGLKRKSEADNNQVYVFKISGFSTQTIEMSNPETSGDGDGEIITPNNETLIALGVAGAIAGAAGLIYLLSRD